MSSQKMMVLNRTEWDMEGWLVCPQFTLTLHVTNNFFFEIEEQTLLLCCLFLSDNLYTSTHRICLSEKHRILMPVSCLLFLQLWHYLFNFVLRIVSQQASSGFSLSRFRKISDCEKVKF